MEIILNVIQCSRHFIEKVSISISSSSESGQVFLIDENFMEILAKSAKLQI